MSTLHTLKKLLFGETWLLPIGIALVTTTALLIRPLDRHLWTNRHSSDTAVHKTRHCCLVRI